MFGGGGEDLLQECRGGAGAPESVGPPLVR